MRHAPVAGASENTGKLGGTLDLALWQQDYYKTLGVSREADADEIRKAYRRLARKHHPDLNPGDKASEDRFKDVQEAYDILSDTEEEADVRSVRLLFGKRDAAERRRAVRAAQRSPNMGFEGFDFSDAFQGGGRTATTTGKLLEFSGYSQPVFRR